MTCSTYLLLPFSRLFVLFVLSLGLLGAVSCSKEEGSPHMKASFEKSFQIWLAFKNSSNNSYVYSTNGGTFAGFSWTTSIVVNNGAVVERSFEYLEFNDIQRPEGGWDAATREAILTKMNLTPEEFQNRFTNSIQSELSWKETGSKVGKNTFSAASAAWDLDRVYDWARRLVNDQANGQKNIIFEAKNNGMISSCGFWMPGCQDDCFNGLEIRSITAL